MTALLEATVDLAAARAEAATILRLLTAAMPAGSLEKLGPQEVAEAVADHVAGLTAELAGLRRVAEAARALCNQKWMPGASLPRPYPGRWEGLWEALQDEALAALPKPSEPAAPVPRDHVCPDGRSYEWCGGRQGRTHCLGCGAPYAKPVCSHCNDTHRMTLGEEDDERAVMCTRCPTPCQKCRAGGNGPYCERTPCSCACHAEPAPPPQPTEQPAKALDAPGGDALDVLVKRVEELESRSVAAMAAQLNARIDEAEERLTALEQRPAVAAVELAERLRAFDAELREDEWYSRIAARAVLRALEKDGGK